MLQRGLPILLIVLFLFGAAAEATNLVIYSGRNERFVLPLIEAFEDRTGIQVQLLSGDAAQYVYRLQAESRNPRADLLISNDGALLEVARGMGLLMAYDSPSLHAVPDNFRAADGSWVGLAARSRVLMYNKDLISEDEMPKSIFDLTDEQWRGQFVITRAGNASMVSHISAVRAVYGDEFASQFVADLLANEPTIVSGHTDIRRAVGAGEFKFGLVNNYYYHLQLEEAVDNNVGAIYPDQGPDEMGVFVNISGIGLVKDAPNESNAHQFIEFLLEPAQMQQYSMTSRETPLVVGIDAIAYALTIDQYNVADLHLADLGPKYNDTLDLMEAAGFAE